MARRPSPTNPSARGVPCDADQKTSRPHGGATAHPRALPRQQPRALDLRAHVREEKIAALVDRDRLAERAPPLRILDGVLEGRTRATDGARRGSRPRQVERPHGNLEPLAFLAEPV